MISSMIITLGLGVTCYAGRTCYKAVTNKERI